MFWYAAPSDGNLTEPWARHTIAPTGNFYEAAVAYDVNGDGAPDIIASDNDQLVYFINPVGYHGDPTQPWPKVVINSNAGAHAIALADMDGDGKMDIVCSGSSVLGSQAYIAFQNNPSSWQNVNVAPIGDGVALLDIGSGHGSINIVGADGNGNISWWENPQESGGDARSSRWNQWYIAPGNVGNSFATGVLTRSGAMDVVTASNEVEDGRTYDGGLVWFEPPSDRRNGVWTAHTIDASYRDAHQIDVLDMNHDGMQDIVVGEQEQAGGAPQIAADHPGIPSRVTIFNGDGNGGFMPQVLSTDGGQNQVAGDITGNGNMGVLSANHGYYGAANPLELWVQLPGGAAAVASNPSPAFHQSQVQQGGQTAPASASLQPSSITVEAWVTASQAQTNFPAFVSYGTDSAAPYESYILQASGVDGQSPADFYFLTASGQPQQVFGQTPLQPGTRYFLAATYDGTVARLYVNGNLEGTAYASGPLHYGGANGLGLSRKFSTALNNFLGSEAGVAIYGQALTPAQIAAQFAAGPQ